MQRERNPTCPHPPTTQTSSPELTHVTMTRLSKKVSAAKRGSGAEAWNRPLTPFY